MDHHGKYPRENVSDEVGLCLHSSYWQQERFKSEKKSVYYRIVFKGVVALVCDPTHSLSYDDHGSGFDSLKQLHLVKSGAYLSYGEIISTTHEILDIEVPQTQATVLPESNVHSIRYQFLRVDDVLTGGYSIDAIPPKGDFEANKSDTVSHTDCHSADNLTSSTFHYPADGRLTLESLDKESSTAASPSSLQNPSASQPLGYLLLCSSPSATESNHPYIASIKISTCPHDPCLQDSSVAQIVPHPPFLCQVGTFFYKVTSPTSLPILVGPCDDAPTWTHAKILPDTVQEISLRIGSIFNQSDRGDESKQSYLDSASSLEDGVVFLRLSHKKGWIADRRRLYSPLTGGKGGHNVNGIHSNANTSSKYQMVVKDITHLIENIGMQFSDLDTFSRTTSLNDSTFLKGHEIDRLGTNVWSKDSQVDSSSSSCVMSSLSTMSSSVMSTLSISTPLNVLKMRQRKRVVKGGGHDSAKISSNLSTSYDGAVTLNNIPLSSKSESNSASMSLTNGSSDGQPSTPKRPVVSPPSDRSPSRVKPNLYLIRVNAPLGLKILDASHFQVNHLIRRPPSTSTFSTASGSSASVVSSSHSESNVSHTNKKITQSSSIFPHTMIGGKKSSPGVAWEIDSITGKRYLPRGLVFEASKRMEKSNNFVEAMGLIKLADNTGWAIVPTREELLSQYASGKQMSQDNVDKNVSANDAFEEIGNAFIRTSRQTDNISASTKLSGCWLRIVHRDGVTVSCSPLHFRHNGYMDDTTTRGPSPDALRMKDRDSDSHSSTGSLLGTKYLPVPGDKRSTTKTAEENRSSGKETTIASDRTALTAAFKNSAQHHIQRQIVQLKISCGMCAEVEPSHDSSLYKSKKYVRLCDGQGWIPQMIDGSVCAVEINKPKIRFGSFWFRVVAKKGVVVRTCPYEQADVIKSDDAHFRFECGEFLRASEVITADAVDDYFQDAILHNAKNTLRQKRSIESFAKLYRRDDEQSKSEQERQFISLVSRGEWVHISRDDVIYMEEYNQAPIIQRRRDGWNYKVVHATGEAIRYGPSFMAELSGNRVREGDVCVVNEIVTAPGDHVTWFRLKNGKGWINSHTQDLEPVAVAIISSLDVDDSSHGVSKSCEPAYGKIFGRLF